MPRLIVLVTLATLVSVVPAADAQQGRRMPVIGVLWPNPPASFEPIRQGLRDLGYVEGEKIAFEYRWAQDRLGALPELAAELVRLKVDVIVTLAPPAGLAAKAATRTIPIVCVAIGDPVASGLVTNLAHPGENLTGTTRMLSEMSAKHVELLKALSPSLTRLALLRNPENSSHVPAVRAVETTSSSLAIVVRVLDVRGPGDLDPVFAALRRDRPDGIVFLADPVFFIHLRRVTELITDLRVPAASNFTEFARLGGLVSYAPSLAEEFRRAATYVDKILKGAKAGDLPIEQPTKFELVINQRTAKSLGLTVPQSLLLRADNVVE